MPSYNFTIPDSSPVISYMPPGVWGDSDSDQAAYTNGTFHFTNAASSYLQFEFNGTGVELFGAYRANHGQYTVTVDGGHSFTGNGGGKGDVFNTSLFGLSGLAAGTHTVKLTNDAGTAGTYVDLDWAVVTLGDGHTGSPNDDVWVDDAAGNWTWGTNWAPGTNDLSPQYYQSTFHATNAPGAKASFSFYGNGVQLYGATSMNHGPYTVALDGAASVAYNGSQVAFRPQQLLYVAAGLPTGMHTVTLANTGTTYTDLDYAIVSRYGEPQGSTGPSAGPSSVPASNVPGSSSASNTGTTAVAPGAGTSSVPQFTMSTPAGTATSDTTGTSTPGAASPSPSNAAPPRSRAGAVALGALALCSFLVAAL